MLLLGYLNCRCRSLLLPLRNQNGTFLQVLCMFSTLKYFHFKFRFIMCTTVPSSSWKSLLWEFVFFVVIWQSGGLFIFCQLVTVFKFIQIGLDGIRMLDPNTSRTLRIYPLENITRCDVSQLIFFNSSFSSRESLSLLTYCLTLNLHFPLM